MDVYSEHFQDLMAECGVLIKNQTEAGEAASAVQGCPASVPPLAGVDRKPMYSPQKEQFAHRAIAFAKAEGCTVKEAAERFGISPVTVGYLKKQPWFEEMVLQEIHRRGGEALDVLAAEAVSAAQRLIEIAKTAENDETRRKANNDILDRKYGKPNQPMSVQTKKADEMSDADLMRVLGSN